jgi:hypothetical protein
LSDNFKYENIYHYFIGSIVKNEVYGDDSETVTFHDAVSDEEDILIEDLELDNDSNLQHTRNIDDLSIG